MKKSGLLFVMMFYCMLVDAQQVPSTTDNEWNILFQWVKKSDGYYHLEEGGRVMEDIKKIRVITHNKKNNEMYAADEKGCYHVKLQPNWSAYIKNEYQYDNLKEKALEEELKKTKDQLELKFSNENNKIRLQKEADEQAAIKREKEKEEMRQKELTEYKKNNPDFKKLPIDRFSSKCLLCESKNVGSVLRQSGDTIFTVTCSFELLDYPMVEIHAYVLTDREKNLLATHLQAYSDSLKEGTMCLYEALNFNAEESLKYMEFIKKKAPNGFIERWGWSLNSAYGIEPRFTFFNTSNKTIKYVDFYFNIFNAVGDKCYLQYEKSYTGKVRGVGPVESFSSGSWAWDRATHYTSGDASEMRITKLVITYMDGSLKTIPKELIVYNNE